MKPITKFKWFAALILIAVNTQSLFAQTKADIFDEKVPITWLGVDYSQTKFIGAATNTSVGISAFGTVRTKDNGIVTNDDFRDNYTVLWNQLFIDEAKKFNIAKAVHRESVKFAIDVCTKANKALATKDFFSNNPSDFKTITEANISDLVKNYDFMGNDGIGLMFFVEGMSKGQEAEGVWITFVDMKSKTVLLTKYVTPKPGGFGFRNYWAKPFYTIVKDMESDFKKWGKA